MSEVTLEWSSGNREARISDLSAGGCYVDSIAMIPEGELVSFTLAAGDGIAIPLTGRVAYVMPGFGFGIEFMHLSDDSKSALAQLITKAN